MGSSAMERTKGGGKKGSLGIIDDDDEDNEDQAEGQEVEVVDRRAGLSKQDTDRERGFLFGVVHLHITSVTKHPNRN